jgi:Tol biopolymer transport system component
MSLALSLLCSAPPLAAEPLDVELSDDVACGGALPQFRISQDGGRVAFLTRTEPREVLSVPIEGGTAATLTPPGTESPALVDAAPDGSRVLMTARAAGSLTEIFSAPFAGGEVPKLNQTLAPGASAFPGPITPDSTRVVYGTRTDCVVLPSSDVSCPVELFVAPLEGGASTPLDLPDLPFDGPRDLSEVFSISPDGELGVSAMYERLPADENEDPDPVALFSTPLAGGPATVLHEANWLSPPFAFTNDGQRVVYNWTGNIGNPRITDLYSVSPAGGMPAKLSALTMGQGRLRFAVTPDGSRLLNAAAQDRDFLEIYSVSSAGGPTTRLSHPDGIFSAFPFQMAPDGERVVFAQYVGAAFEHVLVSVLAEGGEPTRLSTPFAVPPGFSRIRAIRVSPDGRRVVYAAEQDTPDLTDLYSVPIEGGPITRLGGPVARGRTSASSAERHYRITPDGTRVVFVVDTTNDAGGLTELYSVPTTGGVVTKLNGAMDEGEQIDSSRMEVSPDSHHVVFAVHRLRDLGRTPELHSARLPPDVRIDVRPRNAHNRLRPGARVPISVAILGSEALDVAGVDVATLAFGPDGAAAERKVKRADVDGDGFRDLVTRYRLRETGIERGDTEACLTGVADGFEFESCEAIPCGEHGTRRAPASGVSSAPQASTTSTAQVSF